MSLLNRIFKSSDSKEVKTLPWKELKSISQLDEIERDSKSRVQAIFKHSTRCGISSMVMKRFVSSYEFQEEDVDLYYLDLLNYREVSNETGYKFQVLHQSPQLLIIKNGETIHHSSHHNIDANAIQAFI
ncbi:MAG: bacillithiol system redox-active protein YtxJ [Flavobacteriaceae bacterium]|nr:bacillithiol system redox-active protein YtxJ [Flavobacteriaceae bacterium]